MQAVAFVGPRSPADHRRSRGTTLTARMDPVGQRRSRARVRRPARCSGRNSRPVSEAPAPGSPVVHPPVGQEDTSSILAPAAAFCTDSQPFFAAALVS